MTELVFSGYLKSDTPRADMRQATVLSCCDEGERESREKIEGRRWVDEERGRVGRHGFNWQFQVGFAQGCI